MQYSLVTWALQLASLTFAAVATNSTEPGTIPGTTSHFAHVRGQRYHYLLSEPRTEHRGTILLLHGLPDVSYGWRYQIPMLSDLGYRIIAPDMLGYAGTDAPCSVTRFAHKEMASDMADLVGQIVPGEQVIVGGHDWGAGLTYKLAIWHPELVKAFFTIAIPYLPPWLGVSPDWVDIADLVNDGTLPTLGYQLQWRDPAIERNFTTTDQVRMLYNTAFGGLTADGQSGYSSSGGFNYDLMPLLGENPLVNRADMDFYVNSLLRNGVRGAFTWYRTRRMDWEDELPIATSGPFQYKMPVLFMPGTRDYAMPKELYENMDQYFTSLKIQAVEAGHWTHWEGRERVNEILAEWIPSLD